MASWLNWQIVFMNEKQCSSSVSFFFSSLLVYYLTDQLCIIEPCHRLLFLLCIINFPSDWDSDCLLAVSFRWQVFPFHFPFHALCSVARYIILQQNDFIIKSNLLLISMIEEKNCIYCGVSHFLSLLVLYLTSKSISSVTAANVSNLVALTKIESVLII